MKIFSFENIIGNYCRGDFYFVAKDKQKALKIALKFQDDHNIQISQNQNYTIKFDQEKIQEFEIKEGYLPLNRTVKNKGS